VIFLQYSSEYVGEPFGFRKDLKKKEGELDPPASPFIFLSKRAHASFLASSLKEKALPICLETDILEAFWLRKN